MKYGRPKTYLYCLLEQAKEKLSEKFEFILILLEFIYISKDGHIYGKPPKGTSPDDDAARETVSNEVNFINPQFHKSEASLG